ncbi:hypothetical protein [Novipirellula artificiosorum]|uniref:Chromosome partition protein Smc n=1 Tax=Novipirellula artificiosorum TaxID=2528016 RepID=A0A5C6DTK9_9BACT|nr:hypothetical protein [Novipirellula artificiosorum]TWU39534.1 hypothetical protein Poly41_23890 [Novipirellula artificiosorum]
MNRTIACIILVIASHAGAAAEPQIPNNDKAAKHLDTPNDSAGKRALPPAYTYEYVAGRVSDISAELTGVGTLIVEQPETRLNWRLPLADDYEEGQRKRLAIAILRSGASVYRKMGFSAETVLVVRYSRASLEKSGRHLPKVIELLQRFSDPDHTPDDRDVSDQRDATRALEMLGLRYDENRRLVDDGRGETELWEEPPGAFDKRIQESVSVIEQLKRGYISAENQAAEFAVEVRGGLDPERADIGVGKEQREQLERLVAKAFELRLSLQRKQLADAEERLTATRKRLDRREDSAKSIIERRVDALLFRIDESLLKPAITSPSQVEPPANTPQNLIDQQTEKHPELERFKRYFGLELARDADGRIVFYRRSKIEGEEEPVNELRHLVQLKFLLVNLENPGERTGSETRQINDVEDVAKFLREDSARLASNLVVYSVTANQESGSKARTYFELIPGPETTLDPEMREKLSQTRTVLAKHLLQARERMGRLEKSDFDERQNQAFRDTVPTEIVKLEVELNKFTVQKMRLKMLQSSEPSQRLAEVLEKLESPSINQNESAFYNEERVRLERTLSPRIRAIIGSDVSLSDEKVGTASAGIDEKAKVLATRIADLQLQLALADQEYQQAKDNRSEASRLRAAISRIEEYLKFVAKRLSSAGNGTSESDDANCQVGISCDRAFNIHYIDRPVAPAKRSGDGKEHRLDAKVVRFVAPVSGPFNLRLSISDGKGEKSPATVLNVNVAIDFVETETLSREGMEFRISDEDLDFLEAHDRVTIALFQSPAGSIESRRIRELLDSPSSVLAYSDDPTKILLAVVSIRNLNEDLRFLKLAGTWTPVADSVPHIDQELLTSSPGADIHFSVDKLLWTSLPVDAKANEIVKFYSDHYADSELTPVVTGTVQPRRYGIARAEDQKEFFVVFRKSGGDTVLVIGVVLGSRPAIKLSGDKTLMQLTLIWNGSDGFPSPLPHDSEWSVPISYRPRKPEFQEATDR